MIIPLVRGFRRYAIDHWRGNHGLARSVFINTILPNGLLRIVNSVVSARIEESNAAALLAFMTGQILFSFVIIVWQAVGILRSAKRTRREHGMDMGTLLAFIYAPGMFIISLYFLYNYATIDYRVAEMAFNLDKDLAGFEVELLNDSEISLDGGITSKSVASIQKLLETNDDVKIIHLTSIGGYLVAADALIALVQEYKLETYVSWECASACASVFLASEKRSIGLDGYLGFHSADCPGKPVSKSICEEVLEEEVAYLRKRGVAEWFIEKATAIASDDMWEPTFKELADAEVITHVFDGETDIVASDYCSVTDCSKFPVLSIEETAADDGS